MGGSTATKGPSKEGDDKDDLVLWRANREEFNKRLRCAPQQQLMELHSLLCHPLMLLHEITRSLFTPDSQPNL